MRMPQHITHVKVLIGIAAVLAVAIAALFLLFVDPTAVFSLDQQSSSVELGLAEYSPRGVAGGQAMPASGASEPPSCGISFSDNPDTGETTMAVVGTGQITYVEENGADTTVMKDTWNGSGDFTSNWVVPVGSPDASGKYEYYAEVTADDCVFDPEADYWFCTDWTDSCSAELSVNTPPSVTLQIEGGENGEITIGEDAEISWNVSGYPEPTCTASTVAPDNTANWTGGKAWDGGPDTVSPNPSLTEAAPSATYKYTLDCENVNGENGDTGELTVTSKPNLAVTSVSPTIPPPSDGDPVTGTYPNLTVNAVVAAEYADVTAATISYEFELVDANTGVVVDTKPGDITGGINGGNSKTVQATFNNVSFGDYRVDFSVDLPPPGVVDEDPVGSETVDNQNSSSEFNLPPPTPPISLTADPSLVHKGQTSDVTWDVNVGYDIDCTIDGNFSGTPPPPPISTAAGNLMGTFTTPSLNAETTYTLECIPPSGGPASVTETIRVLPTVEET